jgi:hypothetical protein
MSAAAGSERPEVRIEPVFYECFLAGFREPVHVDVLRLIGDFLHTLAIETFYWVGAESRGLPGLRSDASAVARDLEHLAEFLGDLGGGICDVEPSSEESDLRREAEGWSARLGCLAGEIRAVVEATE